MPSRGSTRSARVAFAVFYVVPLLASAGALWAVGLPELAAALLLIEAGVLGAMSWARRPPPPGAGPGSGRG